MAFVLSFIVAMAVSMALLPILIRFGRQQFADQPSPRKVHSTPIPRIGGVAIALGAFAAIFFSGLVAPGRETLAIFGASLIILVVGVLDDRNELDYRIKLAAQIAAAAVVVFGGEIYLRELALPQSLVFPLWIAYPLSVFLIVALTNAVALSDGLDGLAGGIVFLCCIALAIFAYSTGNAGSAILAIAIAGAIFGFLRFNTHPAVVFMGDSGSQFLGLLSAVLAIEVTQSDGGRIGAALPLLLLAIPIIDTSQVIVARLLAGGSPFKPDKRHLHHRLLDLGLAHHQVVISIYAVQCVFFLLAYFLRFESDVLVLAVFVVAALLVAGAVFWLTAINRGGRRPFARLRVLPRVGDGQKRVLAEWSAYVVFALLAAYLVLVIGAVAMADTVPASAADFETLRQIQWLALALFTAVVVSLFMQNSQAAVVIYQGAGYVAAAMLAFLANTIVWPSALFAGAELAILAVLGVAVLTWLALYNRYGSQLTTLDVLILFGAFVIPNLSGLDLELQGLSILVLRLVCFFYATEVVAVRLASSRAARVPLLVALALFIVYPLFLSAA